MIAKAGLKTLRHAIADAPAEKLAKVISAIDSLPNRADADCLLELARPRLRGLGLARPMQLERVLFLPLDPLIVAPPHWEPGTPQLPRTVLQPLADAVKVALGTSREALVAFCAGRTMAEAAAVAELGAKLWPSAAVGLPAAPPPGWAGAGLPERIYAAIAGLCAAAWRHAVAVWPALNAAPKGPPEKLVRDALAGPLGEGELAVDVALRALLARAARPAEVLSIAHGLTPTGSCMAVVERLFDELLDTGIAGLHSGVVGRGGEKSGGLSMDGEVEAAMSARRLVEDLEASPLSRRPDRQAKLRAVRAAADAGCRKRFAAKLATGVIDRVTTLAAAPDRAEALANIELSARALRRINGSARALGGAAFYDASLRSAVMALTRTPVQGGQPALRRAEALRLAEILIGPDAAADLLDTR